MPEMPNPQPKVEETATGFHLVPEPGIFVLIGTAGFLFMVRRRG